MTQSPLDVLKSLVEAGRRFRATTPVDDDFVGLKIEFDMQLEWAQRFISMYEEPKSNCVLQEWVHKLPMMQQTVLLTGIRGCDGLPKYHPAKYLQRWYRRCFLLSAMDHTVISHPGDNIRGGSFTGPIPQCEQLFRDCYNNWEDSMDLAVDAYIRQIDEVPHHFHLHLMHGAEILGYKHPKKRNWWHKTYLRFVNDMHLRSETMEEMDQRLSDDREEWLKRNDPANVE